MTISKTRMALLVVGCLLFILFAATATAPLQAQTTDDIWSTPENISQSGAATNLVVTTDNSGQIVLLWRDALAGFMVTQGDGTDWATPQNVRLPFSDPPFGSFDDLDFTLFTPALVIDDTQQVHSFWRNEENELVYSQVALADLAIQEAWSVPFVLAESANSFDVALDATGKLHVVMLQAQNTAEVPAGIYYRYSEDGGLNWAETVNLYESDYLRTVSSEQIGLKLVTNDDEQILVGWDNPALEAVYVIRSPNGGVGWTAPLVVDQREVEDSVDALGPSGIDVAFNGAEAHVTWRASHGNEECAQYHQVSTDGGETWQPAAVISSELACPTEAQLLVDKNGVVFLLATAAGQAYLLAWDGLMWSEPELQTAVPNFLNPTTNRLVTDSCAYPIVGDENQLLIFGGGICSNSALKVEDVWVRERPLGSLEDWFVSENVVWSNPVAVSTDQDELETPIILTDAAGLFHAFWLGSNPISNAVTPTAI
jgi:hypothetical protein